MGGVYFAMKAEFKDNPVKIVTFYILIAMVIFGFGVRIGERYFFFSFKYIFKLSRSYQYVSGLDFDYIWNSLWMVMIIITTGFNTIERCNKYFLVGYGDFTPKAYLARFFGLKIILLYLKIF